MPDATREAIIADLRSYPAFLDTVEFDQFTSNLGRDSRFVDGTVCHALPAKAIAWRYPDGCLRTLGHGGDHYLMAKSAGKADERERRRGATTATQQEKPEPQQDQEAQA